MDAPLVTKKFRHRCTLENCNFSVMKLIGGCTSCKNYYCHIHRIPDNHKCKYLSHLKEKEKMKLESRLLNESTAKKSKINCI